jgi:hypothetical protein
MGTMQQRDTTPTRSLDHCDYVHTARAFSERCHHGSVGRILRRVSNATSTRGCAQRHAIARPTAVPLAGECGVCDGQATACGTGGARTRAGEATS